MMDMTYVEIAKAFAAAGGAGMIFLSFVVSFLIPRQVEMQFLTTQRAILFAVQGIALFTLGAN